MHEEMMRKFETAPSQLPVLEICKGEMGIARIEPRALWIIGANGRLDMFVGDRHFITIDAAENFHKPEWKFAPLSDRLNKQPLSRQTFSGLLTV